MKKCISSLFLFIALFINSCPAFGEVGSLESWIDSVGVRMAAQLYNFPQEKMHVTTDQGRYVAGDTVWFRMFTVDAATNVPTRMSYYGYVDVTDPLGRQKCRIKIRRDSAGVLSGYIPTDVDWPEGVYRMRAYTAFMQNAGDDYFFAKNLPLVSPYRTQATLETRFGELRNGGTTLTVALVDNDGHQLECKEVVVVTPKGRHTKTYRRRSAEFSLGPEDLAAHAVLVKADNYEKFVAVPVDTLERKVRFYAEGGYLVPDVPCIVGVRVTDGAGRSAEATGSVVDSGGNEVARFSTIHGGLGSFAFVPQSGESYQANVGGRVYPLPEVSAEAAVIQLKTGRKDYVVATAAGNVPEGSVLLVHNRGRGIYIDRIGKDAQLKFTRKELGEGVVSFLLTDSEGRALSERLLFNMPEGDKLVGATAAVSADGRELTITVPESVGQADVTVAVLDGHLAEADTLTTIGSQLLLQSDLRGEIEDAAWYFSATTPSRQAQAGLEALMLTQGWRRYDVPAVLRGQIAEPQIPVEQGPAIIGTVKSRWRKKPVKEAVVSVMIPVDKTADIVAADKNGVFTFNGLDWSEDASLIVLAKNTNGDVESNVQLDIEPLPEVGRAAVLPQLIEADEEHPVDYDYRIDHLDGAMRIQLGEVVVKKEKKYTTGDLGLLLAQTSVEIDKLRNEEGVMSYEDVLRRLPGIIINNGSMTHRGMGVTFLLNSSIVWSGTRNFGSYIQDFEMAYPLHLVKRIDFIPSYMSLAFSSRGTPLVNVVLKDPKYMPKDKNWDLNQFWPLGYQRAAEYFTPDYSAPDYDPATEAARPLLYWLPSQTVSADKPLRLAMPEAVKPCVVVEGIADTGAIVSR